MKKVGGAHVQNTVRQGKYSLQEVVSEIREIAWVSEKIIIIDSLMKEMSSLANLFSIRAIEAVHTGDADKRLALAAHEACRLAEFSSEQSKVIESMFTEIEESIGKINCSTNKFLNSFGLIDQGVKIAEEQEDTIRSTMKEQGCGCSPAPRASGTEQVNKAVEVIYELAKMNENIFSLVQSVSRFKV